MVWCTYCGQEFSRAEHLDRHVLTHTNIKPYKCSTCHFSFKRRDLLQRHFLLMHNERDDTASDADGGDSHRQPIACSACAKAKTKCDKRVPTCSRCDRRGLICQRRSPKRSNDAAFRLARQQLNRRVRPVNIAPLPDALRSQSSTQYSYSEPFVSSQPIATQPQFMETYSTDLYSRMSNQYFADDTRSYETSPLVDSFALQDSPRDAQVLQGQSSSPSPCYTPSAIPSAGQEQAMSSTPVGWSSDYSAQAAIAPHLVTSNPTAVSGGETRLDQGAFYSGTVSYGFSPESLMRSPSSTRSSTEISSVGDLSITSGDLQAPFTTSYSQSFSEPSDYYPVYYRNI